MESLLDELFFFRVVVTSPFLALALILFHVNQ